MTPMSSAPAPTQNPDSGAAELMSPGSVGATVAAPAAAQIQTVDAVTWMKMVRDAMAAASRKATGPHMPGYAAPVQVLIAVPLANVGVGGHGISFYESIESSLQQAVEGLAGAIASQDLTDAQVSAVLLDRANSVGAWSNAAGTDPGGNNIPGLVAKYTAIYRVAVTPV